jgi:predicted outer membrane repeat protein
MMIISALTTLIAITAVVSVIGYRVFNNGGAIATDGIITLPKGARVLSTSASAGRVAVLIDIGGVSELRTFDIKTLKQTGRLRFAIEP